jgi:phage-related protein
MIEKVAPLLVQTIARALIQAIPSLLNAVYQMITGLAKGIYQGIVDLFKGGAQKVVEAQTNEIAKSVENQNALTEAVEETVKAQKGALAGFDEINTLSKDTAENTEDLALDTQIPLTSSDLSVGIDVEETKKALPIFEKIYKALQPIIDVTKKWFESLNFEPIRQGFSSLLEPLSNIGKFFQDVMFWVYTEILLPLSAWTINEYAPKFIDALTKAFEALGKIVKPIWKGFQTLYDYMKPIFDWIGETIIDIVESLGNMFSYVGKVFEEKGDKIQEIFEAIGQAIQWVWEKIEPIFNWIKDIVIDVFDNVDEIIGGFIDTLYDLIQFFKNVFQGDWESAWDSIASAFKNVVNIIIKGINILIRGINKIDFNLPKWLGGGHIGFNIPEIPRLAQGAVIPPNREFLAVLGDQKHGTNIEAPLDTIVEAFNIALSRNGGNTAQDNRPIVLQIDGREIARATRQGNASLGTQTVFGGFANAY